MTVLSVLFAAPALTPAEDRAYGMTLLVAAVALLMIVLGALSRTGRLRPNFAAGIRVHPVTASDDTWRVGHRAASWWFLGYGLVGVVVLAGAWWWGGSEAVAAASNWYLLAVIPVLLVATYVAVRAVRAMRR